MHGWVVVRGSPRDNRTVEHGGHLRQAKARVGERAGSFTLFRLVDLGGMAAVYEGRRLNRRVAVKVLHRSYLRMEVPRERFTREGYAANRVAHPDVVPVLEDGHLADGTPFFAMELLDGCSLERYLGHHQTLAAHEVLWIADRILDVLAAAHARGVIHRDIKPGNIFLTTAGRVKVLDFGLARLRDGSSSFSLTKTGTVIGTASYMSPEQALRKPALVDHRADLWSLGAIMFRSLAGRTVHGATGTGAALIAAATRAAPPLLDVAPDTPSEVAEVVDRALAFHKDDRWPLATAMQRAVRHAYAALKEQASDRVSPAPALRAAARSVPPGPADGAAAPMSVTYSEQDDGDSIIVEVDSEGGKSERYQLRRRSSTHMPRVEADEMEYDAEQLDPASSRRR